MKLLTVALMVILSLPAANAQTYGWQKPPKEGEKIIGEIMIEVDGGVLDYFSDGELNINTVKTYSDEQLYQILLDTANSRYSTANPFNLRNFIAKRKEIYSYSSGNVYEYKYYVSAVVAIQSAAKPVENPLSKALDKALIDVHDGSRIAIDQIRVPTGMNKEDYKDEVVEVLLEKGFKVVAKEYLERLFEEQKSQQSGVYNEKTTVKEDNFSAVGYYLNVKLTETALRVQVINVSTGEYDGNVTIKLQ